jgi:predicted outer membrane protein
MEDQVMSKRFVTGLASVLFLAGSLLAGGTGDGNWANTSSGGTAANANSTHQQYPVDKLAAGCLLLSSQEEILVNQYAAGRAQSDAVKQFAQSLTTDHVQLVAQLQRFTPQSLDTQAFAQLVTQVCSGPGSQGNQGAFIGHRTAGRNASHFVPVSPTRVERPALPGDPSLSGSDNGSNGGWNKTQKSSPSKGGNSSAGNNGGMTGTAGTSGDKSNLWKTVSTIQSRASAYTVCLTKRELSQVPADQFDKAYLSQQIGAHIGVIAHIRAVKPYVSGEFKTVLDSAEKTAQGHLDQANSILKNWSNQNSTASGYSSNN